MQRRLTLAIVGAVVTTIVLVGVGTLVLARLDARRSTEDDLARHIEELAAVVGELSPQRAGPATRRLEPALDVDDVRIVPLAADTAPAPLTDDEVARLLAGEDVSGRRGDVAHAASPLPAPAGGPPRRAVVAVDSVDAGIGSAGRWFVLAAAVTVALGAVLAGRLGRSVTEPLADAEAATRRIASGDLDVRLPVADGRGDEELARLGHSVNAMAASLARARSLERDFLLSVSHDLRTPLTSIAGWAEALSDGTAPEPAIAGATILGEAQRLDRLVRDLLDLARLRARAFALVPRRVDLRDVAAGVVEGLRPELEDADLEVVVELPKGPVTIDADPDRLAQIAANLVDNAGRHAVALVRVTVSTDGGHAVLSVDDDGPGVPLEERDLVFERLYGGGRTAARTAAGTGLGLAIVRELARAMGGDAAATDAPSGGARFEVRLPRPST